jgi:hypothetical protein
MRALDATLSPSPAASQITHAANLAQLHVNAGLLIERYLQDSDPCIAVWLSRQFRLISENPAMSDTQLKVLYRTLAARWHQMATQILVNTLPTTPWLDEFPEGP